MTSGQRGRRNSDRGQAVVETALILPVLLLIMLFAIDFGRAFFGYIIVNNASRIGANYAATHPKAWTTPGDPDQLEYAWLITQDTNVANCDLVSVPTPIFTDGSDTASPDTANDVGDRVRVDIRCSFRPLTPIIGSVVGTALSMTASSEFPVRAGKITGKPAAPPASPPPPPATCTAPNFTDGEKKNDVTNTTVWADAGFTGTVTAVGPNNNWKIAAQDPPPGDHPCLNNLTIYKTAP
jgi:Flp pilus assembly protein TadG